MTGFGEAESVTAGASPPPLSRIVTRTDDGLPAKTDDGSRAPSATVNVSSSSSSSRVVATAPVPDREFAGISMLASGS